MSEQKISSPKSATDVNLSLLENANSFVAEALDKAVQAELDSHQWKFAILHIVQAIELALKELLKRQHPVLIFKNVDNPEKTVSLDFALSRLQKIGEINFDAADIKTINIATDYRNKIVHYEFSFTNSELKLVFAKLLGFLQHFYSVHYGGFPKQNIPNAVWQKALGIVEYADELRRRAIARFESEGIKAEYVWVCRHCGWDAFVIKDRKNTCYICGATDTTFECDECHHLLYCNDYSDFQKDGMRICSHCIEQMEGRWSDDEEHRRLLGLE